MRHPAILRHRVLELEAEVTAAMEHNKIPCVCGHTLEDHELLMDGGECFVCACPRFTQAEEAVVNG